ATATKKQRSLGELATLIWLNHEFVLCCEQGGKESPGPRRGSLRAALLAGYFLTEAKGRMLAREWSYFVRKHCGFTKGIAEGYVRLAANRQFLEASGDIASMTLQEARELLRAENA